MISQSNESGATMTSGHTKSELIDQNPNSTKVRLKRQLGLLEGVSIIVGVIIGSGIFVTPKGVLGEAGSPGVAIIVWILCGLLSWLGAQCFAELGTCMPESGGDYSYISKAYGSLPSFLFLWVTVMIIIPGGNAVAALTFANYLLQPIYIDCPIPEDAVRLVAVFILVTLILVNCISVKWSLRIQNSFTFAKLLALFLIILFGVYYIVMGKTDNLTYHKLMDNSQTDLGHLAVAFYSGIYCYSGWNALNFVTEELKNPLVNLPRAITISMFMVTVIYVLTNISYFTVLTPTEILDSNAIAVTFGDRVLGYFRWVMPIAVALSTTSGLNAAIFSSSRILFVGARQGHLPDVLSMISVNRLSPVPSLLFLGALSLIYLSTTRIHNLINYLVLVEASFSALSVSTVIMLRHKYPDISRPLRVSLILPILYLLVSMLLIFLPIYANFWGALIAISILLLGIPIYYLTYNWREKPKLYQKSIDNVSSFIQKLTLCIKPDEEDLTQTIPTIELSSQSKSHIVT